MKLVLSFRKEGPIRIARKIDGWVMLAPASSLCPDGWVPETIYRSRVEALGGAFWKGTGDIYFFRSESIDTTVEFNVFVWIPKGYLGTEFGLTIEPVATNSEQNPYDFLRTPPNYQDI